MTFTKDLDKFLKSKQCKMIGCIFLVLLVSIMIKLSMPDIFEHLDKSLSFKLKFTPSDPVSDMKLSDFTFNLNDSQESGNANDEENLVTFTDVKVSGLGDNIKLNIESTKYKDIKLEGDGVSGDGIPFNIDVSSIGDDGLSKSSITLSAKPQSDLNDDNDDNDDY